ncbi:MAG TPA: DUF5995 family protein [Solirubrobacteraceae bacterium]|jgi:hypothetical protein
MQTATDERAVVEAIDAVAAHMESIAIPLPYNDGIRRFNELYLAVTRAVAAHTAKAAFTDPAFMSRLDVVFANLYFSAVDDSNSREKIPPAWAPLFELRSARGIAPLQFAIAGMNAHINHDLVLALVSTSAEFGVKLNRGSVQHHDYTIVDRILAKVQNEIKQRFTTGLVGDVDMAFGEADDVFANWSVERARDNAWTNAQTLVAIGGNRFLRERFLTALARGVGFAGRALLLRTS